MKSSPAFAATVAALAALVTPTAANALAGGPELCWPNYPLNVGCGAIQQGSPMLERAIIQEVLKRLSLCTEAEQWAITPESGPNLWKLRAAIGKDCIDGVLGAANTELLGHHVTDNCRVNQQPDTMVNGHMVIEAKCGAEQEAQSGRSRQGSRGRNQ